MNSIIFRKSARARRLRLQIGPEGRCTVVIPRWTPEAVARQFVHNHEGWIQKKLAKIETLKAKRPAFRYQTGDTFYWLGEPMKLTVVPTAAKRPTLKIRGDELLVTLHRDISRSAGVRAVRQTIERFYRKKAEEIIRDRLEFFNEHYGFSFGRVTFRNQKTRWGSCSAQKNLNFNWRLAMAPIGAIDSVVAHELCHLKEMNHSQRFWALVAQTIPEYKKWRKWLRENQYLLQL